MALVRSLDTLSVSTTAKFLSAFSIIDDYDQSLPLTVAVAAHPSTDDSPVQIPTDDSLSQHSSDVLSSHSSGVSSSQLSGSVSSSQLSTESLYASRLSVSDFVFIEKHPAYCRPISELSYNKTSQPLGNSSHAVLTARGREDGAKYFLKFNHNEPMLYCEAFLNHLYAISLLQGVGRCYVRYDENSKPIALSSKEIPNFNTFKDAELKAEQLQDDEYRCRFIKILAVMLRIQEDDGHAGNVTRNLELFDADCALWSVTYKIKGGRPGVDNMAPGNLIGRDPETIFKLHEDDIINFPVLKYAQPWYFPSTNAPASSLFSKNPFTPQETEIVRQLKGKDETTKIMFTELLDWMLDISDRFEALARLSIPANLTVNKENVIGMYVKKNREIDSEYWQVLTGMPAFIRFIQEDGMHALFAILIRCEIRNRRLLHDKATIKGYDAEFDDACLPLEVIIDNMNDISRRIQSRSSMTFSCSSSIFYHAQPDVLKLIDVAEARELIEKVKRLVDGLPASQLLDNMSSWRGESKSSGRVSMRPQHNGAS